MKINASTSCGEYYSSIEIEYDADKVNEAKQADQFVGFLFGAPIGGMPTCEEIGEKLIEKLKNTPIDVIKD